MEKVIHLVGTNVNHTNSIFQMSILIKKKVSTLLVVAAYEVLNCSSFRIGRICLLTFAALS